MEITDWLGKNNQLGIDIWNRKYCRNNESFEDWLERVSGGDKEVRELIEQKKFLFGGRILANRNVEDEKITYSNCFDGETKIITKDGIRSLKSIYDSGEEVLVLSNGSWRKAKVQSFGVQPVRELTLEKNGVEKTFIVTSDHVWFASNKTSNTFEEVNTINLKPGMKLKRDLNKSFRSYKPSPFGVAHGFFWGDGDHNGNSRRVNFCGDKIELLPYFTPDTMGKSNGVVTICGIPKIFWDYPDLNETTSYLYGWLAGYFAADGSIDDRGSCVICSSKKKDIDFVKDVLCVLGIPSEEIRMQERMSNLTGETSTIYILTLNSYYFNESFFIRKSHKDRFLNNKHDKQPPFWKVKNVSEVIDKREVFCAVVPETHTFCLEGNILTHNCYVISPPEDSIESIFDCAKKLARTYSYGGGCGTDLSNLAPRGAVVRNSAKSTTGSVSFMDLYSLVTGLICQQGRRGALMLSLSCKHPDLEEFINIKSDLDKVTKANISVRITDDFMKAVKEDNDWELSFTRKETGENISKTVRARDIFKMLCKNNWDMAEPGMLFWDRITGYSLLSNNPDFEYAGVNPCVTGDTLIHTTDGEIPIKDLVGKQPYVYCMNNDGNVVIKQASKVWRTRENARLVLIETARGDLKCTPDHLIHTSNRGWVRAEDLHHGDKISGLNRQMKDETHVAVGITGGKYVPEHRLIASAFYDIEGKDVHHIDGNTLNNRIDNLEVLGHGEHSRVTNTGRHIDVARDEKGCYCKKPVKSKRKSFNLNCTVGTNWNVKSVTVLKDCEGVYDMTVPDVHNFIANRMVVHNCAEEPLPAGGSCLLGALNLAAFVDEEGIFNYPEFIKAIEIAVRALNNVLDEGLEKHPLQEQRDSVRDWRQIGLGIMGLADMLIKMGIRYGSKEALSICNSIGSTLSYNAMLASSKLAKEYGSYPKYTDDVLNTPYFKDHYTETLQTSIKTYGLRNSQLLTCAPTGSISTMIGVSGGIEPIFANSYTRLTKSLHGEDVEYKVYTPIVKEYMRKHGIDSEDQLPDFFVTSADIPVNERIDMQSVWQSHIDASISSTVNLPNETTVEDIENLYMYAWQKGLKGITIYRAGCAREGILTADDPVDDSNNELNFDSNSKFNKTFNSVTPISRKIIGTTSGKTYCKKCACGTLYITINQNEHGDIVETFVNTSKGGICQANIGAINRMVSVGLRSGVKVTEIIDQLKGITCPVCVKLFSKGETIDGISCPDILSKTISEFYYEKNDKDQTQNINTKPMCQTERQTENSKNESSKKTNGSLCPECGAKVLHSNGCVQCMECGWSKCS